MNTKDNIVLYAPVVIKLLQGVVDDSEKKTWNDLIAFQSQVQNYFAMIGLELEVNTKEGFAFLRQPDQDENAKIKVPRLVSRHKLSYEVTLLCVLLREWLEEFDSMATNSRKLFVSNKDIKERIELFFKDKSNRSSLLRNFDTVINKAKDLGFLAIVNDEKPELGMQYEVKRIIKAKITNEKLEEILEKLNRHVDAV